MPGPESEPPHPFQEPIKAFDLVPVPRGIIGAAPELPTLDHHGEPLVFDCAHTHFCWLTPRGFPPARRAELAKALKKLGVRIPQDLERQIVN